MTSPGPALRPGDQLASTVSSTRVAVIRAPAGRRPLIACGGSAMVPAASGQRPAQREASEASTAGTVSEASAATLIGKRYVDAGETVEVLCTASGAGELSCDGAPMTLKAAKPLPASD